jgi:RimJ/RimL family protein N-acetyltransferase
LSNLRLVPIQRSHVAATGRWLLDEDLRDRVGTVRPPSEFEHERWLERQATDPSRQIRVIESDAQPIGMCGLVDIDITYRNAEIWLYVATGRRAGVGHQVVRDLLSFGFGTLGLHRVRARVFAFNEPALRFFPACGFLVEGIEREAVYKRGKFHDVHLFGILAHEFGSG